MEVKIDKIHFAMPPLENETSCRVLVTLSDNHNQSYNLIFATPDLLKNEFEKEEVFIQLDSYIFVKDLQERTIRETLEALLKDRPDGYWIKYYHFSEFINILDFDRIKARESKFSTERRIKSALHSVESQINRLYDDVEKELLRLPFNELRELIAEYFKLVEDKDDFEDKDQTS
nr:hypothetical protein [Navicula tsukamotoi]UXN44528.1 hypothetical protein [Navicula tsukamotoi]